MWHDASNIGHSSKPQLRFHSLPGIRRLLAVSGRLAIPNGPPRLDHQRRVPSHFPRRIHGTGLRCIKGRCRAADQGPVQRMGVQGHQCQRHCSWIHRHRHERGIDQRFESERWHHGADSGGSMGEARGLQGCGCLPGKSG